MHSAIEALARKVRALEENPDPENRQYLLRLRFLKRELETYQERLHQLSQSLVRLDRGRMPEGEAMPVSSAPMNPPSQEADALREKMRQKMREKLGLPPLEDESPNEIPESPASLPELSSQEQFDSQNWEQTPQVGEEAIAELPPVSEIETLEESQDGEPDDHSVPVPEPEALHLEAEASHGFGEVDQPEEEEFLHQISPGIEDLIEPITSPAPPAFVSGIEEHLHTEPTETLEEELDLEEPEMEAEEEILLEERLQEEMTPAPESPVSPVSAAAPAEDPDNSRLTRQLLQTMPLSLLIEEPPLAEMEMPPTPARLDPLSLGAIFKFVNVLSDEGSMGMERLINQFLESAAGDQIGAGKALRAAVLTDDDPQSVYEALKYLVGSGLNPAILLELTAMAMMDQGRFEEAITILEEALAVPEAPTWRAHYHLGDLFLQHGALALSRHHLKEAHQQAPREGLFRVLISYKLKELSEKAGLDSENAEE